MITSDHRAFVIQVRRLHLDGFAGTTFQHSNITNQRRVPINTPPSLQASISLPDGLFTEINSTSQSIAVSSIFYKEDSLFTTSQGSAVVDTTSIISATLLSNGSEMRVSGLVNPIQIQFRKVSVIAVL